jgi:hypothetical protein
MIETVEEFLILAQCTRNRGQPPDVFGMIPPRVVAAAIAVRDECDVQEISCGI